MYYLFKNTKIGSIRKLVREQLQSFCWTNIPAENDVVAHGVNSTYSEDEHRLKNLEECMHLIQLALQGTDDADFKLSKIQTILFSYDKVGKKLD